jgi:hypothetical protein
MKNVTVSIILRIWNKVEGIPEHETEIIQNGISRNQQILWRLRSRNSISDSNNPD